jgi:acyl-CoA thioester hydrolase
MIRESIEIRVRYAETDQMGFVYYGNYAQYFEIGRVEALKKVGLSYRSLEESGIMLPVKELYIDYKKAAKYDDLIRIETTISEMPNNRIFFDYKIFRQEELLVTGNTTLFFMNKNGRPIRPTAYFLNKLRPYFN